MNRQEFLQEFVEARNKKNRIARAAYYTSPSIMAAEPFRMADSLWYVGDKKVSVHLIETNDGLIMLDAGYPNAATLVVDSIWRAGFDPKDVKWIIHSHLHFDHFGVSSEFQNLYGTKLAISSVDAASMRERPDRTHLDSGHSNFLKNPVFDRELEDGEIFEFGGVRIRCVLTPGHTLGAMSFFFDVTDNGKTYLAGMLGGAGTTSALNRFSMEAEGLPLDMPQRMIHSLDYLMTEPVTLHLGNHPYNSATFEKRDRQLREGGNPFVDDGTSWREFLLRTKEKCKKIMQDNAEREEELRRRFG